MPLVVGAHVSDRVHKLLTLEKFHHHMDDAILLLVETGGGFGGDVVVIRAPLGEELFDGDDGWVLRELLHHNELVHDFLQGHGHQLARLLLVVRIRIHVRV